ncbi:MAG: hypothetical protein OEQ53_02790 [Saprospiraceae bacterium]|nr:hypothetical protein [Saprospiraceae bacterium]
MTLYCGFDTKSTKQRREIEQRELRGIQVDVVPIIKAAKESLAVDDLKEVEKLEVGQELVQNPTARLEALKMLSGAWYRHKRFLIAGHYAQKVAEIDSTDEAWSIAGTTYFAGITGEDPMISNACFDRAVECLEYAISLNSAEISHRVNLALVYTRRPTQENPMQGIQMLLQLNENFPDNVLVLTTLGRLAIETKQWDRARERLEHAVEIESDNTRAICLLAEVYQQTGDERSAQLKDKCELLTVK